MMLRRSCEVSGIRDIHRICDVLDLRSADCLQTTKAMSLHGLSV